MWNRMGSRLCDWASLSVIRAQLALKRLEAKARDQRGAITEPLAGLIYLAGEAWLAEEAGLVNGAYDSGRDAARAVVAALRA